jgi:hypothetical protein
LNSLPYNIVLLPGKDIENKAIAASKKLEQFGTLFTLEIGKFYPHVSVYMVQLRSDDLPKVEQTLAEIAATTEPINLNSSKYYQVKNFIDADYNKPAKLTELQMSIVNAINPIRDGLRENDKERMKEATGLALENFRQYGWNTIGELYRPHLTLTRFIQAVESPEAVLPNPSEFNGLFPKLGLFAMGENGTCIKQLAEFNLGQQ